MAIVIAILVPLVQDVINDTDDNRPDIPGVTLIQPLDSSQTAVAWVLTHTSV
ncbi:hypothetical protein [Paenibacillus sp. FSL R5-0345]|uniref:hypothetical protein n=1 Tax=Paenibacillus sp. FSL R5-0345 TaxID=1536770 RepID=UPI000B008C99|nr:hypothetical protein [Paenibacillus sp. FSL R5-0345]